MTVNWFRSRAQRKASRPGRKARVTPRLEMLEDRLAPATHNWIGPDNGNWNNNSHWMVLDGLDAGKKLAPNSPDDVLVFGASEPITTVNDFPSGTRFAEIRLGGGHAINGSAGRRLLLAAAGITSSNFNRIDADLEFAFGSTPIHVLSGTLTIGGVGSTVGGSISGNGGIVKDGPGKLNLGRPNTYRSSTVVAEGVLNIQATGALGPFGGGTTVAAGATLELQAATDPITVEAEQLLLLGDASGTPATLRNIFGGNTWRSTVFLSNSAVVNVDRGPFTIDGAVANFTSPGSLTKLGAGTLTLAGSTANTYTGVTTVNAGNLVLNKTAFNGALAGPLVIGDGSGTDTVFLLVANQIANTSAVTINPSGVLNLDGHNESIGPLTMTGGLATTGAGILRVFTSVTATSDPAGNSARIQGNLALLDPSTRITVHDGPAGVDLDVPAQLGNFAGELIKDGTGRLQLSGANLNTGAVTIDAGFVRVTNAQGLGPAGSSVTTVNPGGTLEILGPVNVAEDLTLSGAGVGGVGALVARGGQSFQTTRLTRPVALAADTTVRTDGNLTLTSALGGNFDLTKTGTAQLSLLAANPNYGGLTTVRQGLLRVTNAQGLGSAAAGDGTVVQAGATLDLGFDGSSAEPLALAGSGAAGQPALFATGNVTLTGPVTLSDDATVGALNDFIEPGSLNLAGAIGGPGDLIVTTAGSGSFGEVTFSGTAPNTYGGLTRVTFGTLRLAKSANTNAVPGALVVEGAVIVQNPEQIPDTAPITINGPGSGTVPTLFLNADETIGPLTLNGGVIDFVPNGVLPDHTLTLTADVTATGRSTIEGGGDVSLGGATRTFTVAGGGDLSLLGPANTLSGAGGLVKAGPGRLQLNGVNTYAGPTTVDEGTLFVSRDLPGPVTVNVSATLTGNDATALFAGSFGDITVAGGTLNPGNDPNAGDAGIMNASGAVTLVSSSTFHPASTFHGDIGGTTPGTGHDQLRLTGNATLDLGNARLDLAFIDNGFQLQAGQSFVIVENETTNPTSVGGRFTHPVTGAVIDPGVPFTINGRTFTIGYDEGPFNNDVVLFAQNTPTMVENLELTPREVVVGDSVVLTGNLIDPDPSDTLTLVIDWDDGSSVEEFIDIGRAPFRIAHQYLAAGSYALHVSWHDQHGAGNARELPVIVRPVTVESVVINDGSAQRSMVTSVTVTFSGVVALQQGAFGLLRLDGSPVAVGVSASVVGGRTVAVLTFSGADVVGGSLADGNYTLLIHGDRILDSAGGAFDAEGDGVAGGDRVDQFFRLFGDADGDRDVDRADHDLFRDAVHSELGDANYLAFFDFDGDGDVDNRDKKEFNRRLGTVLDP
jgi:autotransporter-associated beta strand protein